MIETIKHSIDPANAPVEIKPYSYALKAVIEAVNIKDALSEQSIKNALEVIKIANFDEDKFLSALEIIKS
jgi:hypothetical protein